MGVKCTWKRGCRNKPALDGRSLVGAVIIHDQMHLQFVRHCGLDRRKEAAELDGAVPLMALADHVAGFDVERGEQEVVPWRR